MLKDVKGYEIIEFILWGYINVRNALLNATKKAICIKCKLPNACETIDKTLLTNDNDFCLENPISGDLSKIIYNGIVEYAVNEFKIDYSNLALEQTKVIARKMKYDYAASATAKLKYGFYGEVLLDLVLRAHFSTNVLLARGYLYSPIEKSEVKGFDAFHLIENAEKTSLWLGEAKFYEDYHKPIRDVLEKIEKTLSDEYVNRNVFAVFDHSEKMTNTPGTLKSIVDSWELDPSINISAEMKKNDISIVYPVMIVHEETGGRYYEDIRRCVSYVDSEVKRLSIKIPASFDYSIFFILLPTDNVKAIKEKVIEWIENKEPLI